ncbi:MAG: hypothetical protein ABL886_10600 [Rhodoglobus sp.]
MKRIQRTAVVVAIASLAIGALAACNPGDISGGSTTTPAPTDVAIPTATPTPAPQPVFVAPADCHAMVGAALETEFAGKGIVLFNSTNGEGEFAEGPVVSKQGGGNPISCVWGVPYVDLNSFGLEVQSLTQDAHEGVVAVLGGGGFDVSLDGNIATYSHVGAETGQPEDQSIIHVLHPDGWITAWSSFGGQIAYDRLVTYVAAVTAQVYPAP